jgi:predicted ATPase
MKDRLKLTGIELAGFKSFGTRQSVDFGDINVLIGPNGSGKSNLISFFHMLGYMMTGALQTFIAEGGYANSFLYYGPKRTSRISAAIHFEDNKSKDTYQFSLSHAPAMDTLVFAEETLIWEKKNAQKPYQITLEPGLKESGLLEYTKQEDITTFDKKTSSVIFRLLRNCQVFQFHDTSKNSRIRGNGYIYDNQFLRTDAGNLAAFLYAMKEGDGTFEYYQRVVRYIQKVMPQFGDFELAPLENDKYIRLNWVEKGADYLFGPHQISDGALRFMALATLLLQPPKTLPSVIVLDEPELGLHPSAIAHLAGMVRTASRHCQIILATQSPRLVDEFEWHQITVIERDESDQRSVCKKLREEPLAEWMERYSLSELWEKNVLGGQP